MMAPPETRLTVEVRPRALLAARLNCARSRVEIVRGHTPRTKIVRIAGLTPAEAAVRLARPGPGAEPPGAAHRSR